MNTVYPIGEPHLWINKWVGHFCLMKYKDTTQAEIMGKHAAACKASGQTIADYCKEHGLAPSKFYYWQKRLNDVIAKPGFSQLSPLTMDTTAVTMHFPNGVRVEFSGSVSASSLKELICCIWVYRAATFITMALPICARGLTALVV